MSQDTSLKNIHGGLERFVNGYTPRLWPTLAERLAADEHNYFEPLAADEQRAEDCWGTLSNQVFYERVLSYHTGVRLRDEITTRLVRNARGLFATALVAAAVRAARPERVRRWCRRALDALDPDGKRVSSAGWRPRPRAPAEELLLYEELDALNASAEMSTVITAWTLWRLGLLGDGQDEQRTYFAWESDNSDDPAAGDAEALGVRVLRPRKESGAGEIVVSKTALAYPALLVHPKSALIPATSDWLETVERAWKLLRDREGDRAVTDRAVTWHLNFQKDRRPLAYKSAGGSFYVAFACLHRGYRCIKEKVVLAALPDEEGEQLKPVSLEGKLEALPAAVTKVGVAKGQKSWSAGGRELVECVTLEDAIGFASGLPTKVRNFLGKVVADADKNVKGTRYVEPILYLTGESDVPKDGFGGGDSQEWPEQDVRQPATWMTCRLLLDALRNQPRRVVAILGESGSGKTLLSWQVTREIAQRALTGLNDESSQPGGFAPCLVLWLDAAVIARVIRRENLAESYAPDSYDDRKTRAVLKEAALELYEHHADAINHVIGLAADKGDGGRVLLVVDGFNTIAPGLKEPVTALLQCVSGWPACNLLLTSRAYGFEPTELRGVQVYRIRELTLHQARAYVRDWLSENRARAAAVIRLLRPDSYSRFARVPLLLSLMCQAAERTHDIQPARTSLYYEFFRERLGAKHDVPGADKCLGLLRRVGAAWLDEADPAGVVEMAWLERWLGEDTVSVLPPTLQPREAKSVTAAASNQILIDYLIHRGLLVTVSRDRSLCRAGHPSFVEYLAGAHIGGQISRGEMGVDQLAEKALDRRMRGVLPFVAGNLSEPAPFFDALLRDGDPFHLRLLTAAVCLAEVRPQEKMTQAATRVARSLVCLLRSPARADRENAVSALGRMAALWSDLITPLLGAHLDDPDADVCAAATEAACVVGWDEGMSRALLYVKERGRPARDHILRVLATAGAHAAGVAKELLADSDPTLQATAAETLAALDQEHVGPIIELLKSGEEWSRRIACRALAATTSERAALEVKALLDDESDAVCVTAVEAMAAINCPQRAEAVCGLKNRGREVRAAVAEALGTIGGPVAHSTLLELLDDPEENVVLAALDGLARAGANLTLVLPRLLDDRQWVRVRVRAAGALHRYDAAESLRRLISAVRDGTDQECLYALNELAAMRDPDSVPRLLELFASVNQVRRREIADTLGRIGDKRAAPALLPLLSSPEPNVRLTATVALGQIGDASAVAALTRVLGSERGVVRRAAVRALGMLGTPRALVPLLDCLQLRDPKLVAAAASAIASSSSPNLFAALDERDGLGAFARACSSPLELYNILYKLVSPEDPEVWSGYMEDLTALTMAISVAGEADMK